MSISAMAAGIIIYPSSLPKTAQDFIKKSFPNDTVIYAEQKRKDFKAELQSGIEIKFFFEWRMERYKVALSAFISKFIA